MIQNNHVTPILLRSGLRFLQKHPWLFGLSVLGVALGVALVVSVDLANHSAKEGFNLSAETITGKTTHHIRASGEGIDEELYRKLRVDGKIRKSAPFVEGYARLEQADRTFQVIGIDPLAEGAFRSYATQEAGIDLSTFIAQSANGLITSSLAGQLQVQKGDTLDIRIAGRFKKLTISGLIEPGDERSNLALESVIITDIATAQELLEIPGKLSRIDLILPEGEEGVDYQRIIEMLPEGVLLERSETRTDTIAQMTRAFQLNLNALSMLALLVGMFLIYSTMSFSVVQRRPLIGRLRALGVTRREILLMVMSEAVVIGLLGTIAGLIVGIALAQILVQLVSQTINELYFVLTVREFSLNAFTLIKGVMLGMGATLLVTFRPALEAANSPVSTVLRRSEQESGMYRALPGVTLSGIVLALIGSIVLLIPGAGISWSYMALLLIILGFTLTVPLLVTWMSRVFRPVMSLIFGISGGMASRGIVSNLSRTSVAIAALSVAVAATVGVGTMIESFRNTIQVWMDQQLQADINVFPPSHVFRQADASLDSELVEKFRTTEGVKYATTSLHTNVITSHGEVTLVAFEQGLEKRDVFRVKESVPELSDDLTQMPYIYITEVFSNRKGLQPGDSLYIHTPRGKKGFAVGAVYYDYGSDVGRISMNRHIFSRYFDEDHYSGMSIYAEEGQSVNALNEKLRSLVPADQEVLIRSNRDLREASLEVFDRTFAITGVLRMLALLVAFIGVLSALMALQLERSRELAVLRANGMTPAQLWRYVTLQTGLMGLKAGLLAIPLGLIMSAVLVYVINLRSFGWTLQFQVSPSILMQAVLLALVAAIVAGLYPSYKMSRANPANALREE